MDILTIIESVRAKRVNVSHHAKEEAKNDLLLLDDIFISIYNGEIIEDYPSDKPFPSCLVYGNSSKGEPIHSVWAYDSETRIAILITVYCPDPELWIDLKERKGK